MAKVEETMIGRRDLLAGVAGWAAVAAAGTAFATATDEGGHAGHAGHGAAPHPLVGAALECVAAGEACQAHCLEAFKRGDTSLADCAARVAEMLAGCRAIAQLAALGSSHAPAFTRACVDLCKECEKACRVHEATHEVCRRCADACARFVKAATTPA